MTDKEKEELIHQLAVCQKTVKRLSKDKEILMGELFIVDPNNEVLKGMQGSES